jgi:hypothetical protein
MVGAVVQTVKSAKDTPTPLAGHSNYAPNSFSGAAMMPSPAVLTAIAKVKNAGFRGTACSVANMYILGR